MININKYKNLNLDKNLTSNLILKSFIFNIFYFTIFKLYKKWKLFVQITIEEET